ncbi:OmpL47-type beta-barrel domain-containing protein [Microlunatus sp. Y2014]|uniref:OmpL47-type beta-barrel domain-containing protein n=1 Tax=Microlunatus sp. Y2014 TaxID=3418488 RepID=UPI003DA7917D
MRRSFRCLVGLLALTLLVPLVLAAPARAETGPAQATDPVVEEILAGDERITYLGAPVRSQIGGVPKVGIEDGRAVGYQMFKGIGGTSAPGTLVVFDLETGETLRSFPIAAADNNWGVTVAADGRVYVATYHDYALHRYDPATKTVEDLGPINAEVPKDGYPWAMAPGPGNTVFIGTYKRGDLWQFHPDTGEFENWGHEGWGPDDPDQSQYVRGMTWDETRQELYISTGSFDPAIYRIDTTTREVVRITDDTKQPGLSTESFISAMTYIDGRVFARGYHSKKLLVIDRDGNTEYWGNDNGSLSVQGYTFVQHPTDPDTVLFTNAKILSAYDTSSKQITQVANIGSYLSDAVASPTDPTTLYGLSGTGTFELDLAAPETPPSLHAFSFAQPAVLETVLTGPDNTMWAAGYMSSFARVDTTGGGHLYPTTQISRQYESSIIRDGKMYLGAYTGSSFQVFDPKTPEVAPRTLFHGTAQGFDRPITMTYDPVNDKAYMGSIPGYGLNQGGISVWDFTTSTVQHFKAEVVPDQGVAAAVYNPSDGMVYLGSNVDGGNGHPDSGQTEAYLVVWDPKTDTKVKQLIPVPDRRGITGLTVAADGTVWGIAEDMLFVYDPATGEVERSVRVIGSRYGSGNHWSWGYLAFSKKDDMLYGSVGSRLLRIDPATLAVSNVGIGKGSRMHLDTDGNVYFLAFYGSQHLFKYEPVPAGPDTTAPEVSTTATGDGDEVMITLVATDDASGVARIEYRRGQDAEWTTYADPLPATLSSREVIRYRAVDEAGNVSRIRVLMLRPGG